MGQPLFASAPTPPDRRSGPSTSFDDNGLILLTGTLDEGVSRSVCERLIELNLESRVDFVQLLIHSPGGDCHAGLALIDLMEWSRLPVYTTGFGLVGSMALVLFMAGAPGHRVLMPHTSLLSHRFWVTGEGSHAELVERRRHEDWMHQQLVTHYLHHTRLRTEAEVVERLLRPVDTWLTPVEAVELGLADRIQPARPAATVED